jgi:hypothetical protein
MKTFTDEMALEIAANFILWCKETHPVVLNNLMTAWKKSREEEE